MSMKPKATAINAMKEVITETRDSEIFIQTIYESSNFNANSDTDYILGNYFEKIMFSKTGEGKSFSKLRKEKLDKTQKLGRKFAKVFRKDKLKFND